MASALKTHINQSVTQWNLSFQISEYLKMQSMLYQQAQRASVWTLRLCTVTLCTDICKQFCWVSWPNKHSRSHRPCKQQSLFRRPPKTGAISDPAQWIQNSPTAFSILTTKWDTSGHVDKDKFIRQIGCSSSKNLPIIYFFFFVFCSFHSISYILCEN